MPIPWAVGRLPTANCAATMWAIICRRARCSTPAPAMNSSPPRPMSWWLCWRECQAKDGYLGAYPTTFYDRLRKHEQVWAPFYTYHKIMAGLIDMYEHTGNQQALEMATRMADWADTYATELYRRRLAARAAGGAGRHERGVVQSLRDHRQSEVSRPGLSASNTRRSSIRWRRTRTCSAATMPTRIFPR